MASLDRDICPLRCETQAEYDRLREVLDRADYTEAGIVRCLGFENLGALRGASVPLLLHLTAGGSPLETLIRLFLIGETVEADAVSRAIAPMTLEQWVEMGLLRTDGSTVQGTIEWWPFAGLRLAFDRQFGEGGGGRTDFVMGIGASTMTLASYTVRRPSRASLDLGAGCGALAFLAARHSDRVVAVDRNPRAISITVFNAKINDLANVEPRQGDLFEPVRGESFDLIASNPPFVISPSTRFVYRDSGMHGDDITRTVVQRSGGYLEEGGYAQVLCNWVHPKDQDWKERLADWVRETGCDAWILRFETRDAATYASNWIGKTERDLRGDDLARRFHEWMEYYDAEGIEAMSTGLVTLRRATGRANWFRIDDAPAQSRGVFGDAVERKFAAVDFLVSHEDDADLLDAVLQASPDLRARKCLELSESGWSASETHIELARGLPHRSGADDPLLQFLAGFRQGAPLRAVLKDQCAKTGQDFSSSVAPALNIVRGLVELGFLFPPPR